MGRKPCCEKTGLKRGKWSEEEDEKLINYIKSNGNGSWRSLPKNAGLLRCGKSCRLRWINYLREDLKRGNFTQSEEETIVRLHKTLGNRWSMIASHLPGRTDNEIKNYWNSQLSRRIYNFRSMGGSPLTADMVKMVNTSKKRSGRVRRAVAKKYNNNSNANSPSTPPRTTSHDNIVSSIIVHEMAGGEEDPDPLKTTSLEGSFSSSNDSLCMEVEGKDFDDIFTNFKNILEGDWVEDEGENNMINYENHEIIMNTESDTTSEKRDCDINSENDQSVYLEVDWAENEGENNMINYENHEIIMNTESDTTSEKRDCNTNLENESVYSYSSPNVSYFNDENFHWDLDGYCEELINLWTQEEQDMIS